MIEIPNIPTPGIPESFKVMLKELQALGLDVRVLREDNTEVEIMETIDYGDTDYRYEMEGDRKYGDASNEDLGAAGFQAQEFDGSGELVSAEDDFAEADGYEDDYDYAGEDEF